MYSAKLVGNQMDTVFGLYLPEYEVPAPKVQTNYKEIPYRDGAIDKTAPDGVVTFEDREWSLVFQKTGEDVSAYDVPALSASLMNAIHGKSGEIIFDDDPNYKWVGRVFVENVQCENNGLIIANISLITQPYKYGIQDIVVTDTIETEVDEYQGSIVSFEYGLGKELTKLLAHIEPIQDLHGYDHPWPGGGGKNVMPNVGNSTTFQNVTLTYNFDDSTYTLNGSTTLAGNIPLASISPTLMNWVVGNGYTLSCRVVSGSFTLGEGTGITYAVAIFNSSSSSFIRGGTRPTEADLDGYTGTGNAFSSTGNYQLMIQCWRAGTVFDNLKIRIQIEAGSTATSWSPYSNICPISGLTGLSVYRTSKNLCVLYTQRDSHKGINYDVTSEGIHVYGTATDASYSWTSYSDYDSYPIHLNPGEYTLSINGLSGTAGLQESYLVLLGKTKSGESITNVVVNNSTKSRTFTLEEPTAVQYGIFVKSGLTVDYTVTPQIELGSEATAYEPYKGNTYAVDWSTQAGTVYHGTVDPVVGQLVVDYASVDLGDKSWTVHTSGNVYAEGFILDWVANRPAISSQYVHVADVTGVAQVTQNGTFAFQRTTTGGTQTRIIIKDDSFIGYTATQVKSALAGVQVVYELATPLTYQLTPQEIEALVGTNNIWSDAGNVDVAISTFDMVTLSNGRKPQSPKINVTSEGEVSLMFFVKGTKHIINLAAGEWSVPDLMLFEGDTDVYESGEGTVTYTYKEASL